MRPTSDHDERTLELVARALASSPRRLLGAARLSLGGARVRAGARWPSAAPARATSSRLYVHVPYCHYHCTFCFFAVRAGASADAMARYVARARARARVGRAGHAARAALRRRRHADRAPAPSCSTSARGRLRARAARRDGVHTVETSPETISPAARRGAGAAASGASAWGSRASTTDVLGGVHRRHTREQALAACDRLVDAGLDRQRRPHLRPAASRPGELPPRSQRSPRAACHSLTLYSLRVNERTPVAKTLSDEDRFDLARLMRWRAFVKRSAAELGYTQTRWHTFKRLDTVARTARAAARFDARWPAISSASA